MKVTSGKRGQRRINQVFAFVVLDEDGTEGVILGMLSNDGTWLPFVSADMTRVDSLKEMIRIHPMWKGRKVRILRFGEREEIGAIDRTQEK